MNLDLYAPPAKEPPDKSVTSIASSSRSFGWSLATLFVGIVALTAAVMLHLAVDEPKPQPRPPERLAEIKGGIRLEWKGIKAHFGGKQVEPDEPIVQPQPDELANSAEQQRRYRMVTAAIALIGLAAGPLAVWRESAYALSGPGMTFCFLALTWQYIIAGIAIGVAVLVVLLILSALP